MIIAADDPELQRSIREEPGYAERFVEETLRIEAPVKGMCRIAKRDVRVGDVEIAAGSTILLCYPAANRDPEVFSCPATIDPRRDGLRRQIAFGYGPHLCLGAPVARLEARVALEVAFGRLENVRHRTNSRPPERLPSFLVNAVDQLHLDFEQRTGNQA
jgi:cytochrome P450